MPQNNKPMFQAKIKLARNKLPSAPIHVRISAAPEGEGGDPTDVNRTDVPVRTGSSTLKSQSRAAFGSSTKPYRSPRWAANTAFRMPSKMKFSDEEDDG